MPYFAVFVGFYLSSFQIGNCVMGIEIKNDMQKSQIVNYIL
jgi:hypothetical protein